MILVTGATGRTGAQVVRTLTKLGLPVKALVRKGSAYYWLNDTSTRFAFGDLRDPGSLRRALADVEHLVVCSGIRLEERSQNHQNVTVDGHRALFQAARAARVSRVVLLSCMGAERGLGVPAFLARREVEDALVESGLGYTILRAPPTEHFFLELAFHIQDHGSVLQLGPGTNRLSVLPRRDLALLLAASLDLEAVKDRVISVGGLTTPTASEALALACRVVGVEPLVRRVPSPLVTLSTRIGRPFRRYARRAHELRAWFSEDFAVDPDAMRALFQIPWSTLEDAMANSHDELRTLRDPDLRERRMVHPQFYATVYEAGTVPVEDLPKGPRGPAGLD